MKSYLSRRAGCLYRQTAGFWNIIEHSMMFYEVPMNRSVSTEDSRGLTSYNKELKLQKSKTKELKAAASLY
jgi:hypothetical protein